MYTKIAALKTEYVSTALTVERVLESERFDKAFWNDILWKYMRQAIFEHQSGFKLALKHTPKSTTLDIVTGYNVSDLIAQPHSSENILFKIAHNTAPFSNNIHPLYEDADFFAFPDGNPQMSTHILIISKHAKRHAGDLSYEDWQSLKKVIDTLAQKFELSTFRIDMNTKKAQAIFQFHAHVLSGQFLKGSHDLSEGPDGYPAY